MKLIIKLIKSVKINVLLIALLVISQSVVAQLSEPQIFKDFKKDKSKSKFTDFSYAGYHYGEKPLPTALKNVVDVSKFGVHPNTQTDCTPAVQRIIDSLGKKGGGTLYFPKGRYLFNLDSTQKKFIQINYSNIVIKGAGQGTDGTIFYLANDLLQFDRHPWLSPFLIQTALNLQGTDGFWGIDYPDDTRPVMDKNAKSKATFYPAEILTEVTGPAFRGNRILKVKSTKNVKAGDVILVGMYNTSNDGNLIKELIKPYTTFEAYHKAPNDAGTQKAPSFQWLVEVARIVNSNTIELRQPLRNDIKIEFKPVIAKADMLREIGVEDLRIESAWKGEYCHHGCPKSTKFESAMMDYGWNAINLCRVAHSWVKNVTMVNFTNPVYLLDSRNVTLTGLKMEGFDGHSGIKVFSHASDNLIENSDFYCNYTHILSGEGNAIGNVFTNIKYHYFDKVPGDFDFHGFIDGRFSPPSYNLFDNISGFHQISGGGGVAKLPHTANNNTWWNIEGKGYKKSKEVFVSWLWQSATYKHPQKDHHKLYPGSILVGYYNPDIKLEIDGNTENVQNEWIYTEYFNKANVFPKSLYQEQLKMRKKETLSKK
ncbi:Pectate lyase superfamily protein [compost metagenome]